MTLSPIVLLDDKSDWFLHAKPVGSASVLTCTKSTTCETEEKHTRQLCLHLDEGTNKQQDSTLRIHLRKNLVHKVKGQTRTGKQAGAWL